MDPIGPVAGEHTGAPRSVLAAAGELAQLARDIKRWGAELGFGAVGIADLELGDAPQRLRQWLAQGRHGTMAYLAARAVLRCAPGALQPGALRVISVRCDYLPRAGNPDWAARELARLREPGAAVVSVYARGRDYHRVLRSRLAQLARRIENRAGAPGGRCFADSAPVMEVELARKAGLGWRGKHTLLLSRTAGSMFFLGEILTALPLPVDAPASAHCGRCTRCIDVCPTQAITAPYQLDARRCISYLTIEHAGPIPEPLRALVGNRIYGCDDCQLVCPWNRFARRATLPDFDVRNGLDAAGLLALFAWSAAEFEERLAGSPIRRIGFERWQRNLAVCLGNAPPSPAVAAALRQRLAQGSTALVAEHLGWALARQLRLLPP